jgi:hypothetical protein
MQRVLDNTFNAEAEARRIAERATQRFGWRILSFTRTYAAADDRLIQDGRNTQTRISADSIHTRFDFRGVGWTLSMMASLLPQKEELAHLLEPKLQR